MMSHSADGEPQPSPASWRETVKTALKAGLNKGVSGFVWMAKILIPISFVMAVLVHTGWLAKTDFLTAPAMGFLRLPGCAALPLIVGMLTGIYGGIAAMAMVPLTTDQMTIMAVFLLICHNLPQEAAVQASSGYSAVKAVVYRILAATLMAVIVGRIMDVSPLASAAAGPVGAAGGSWIAMLKAWSVTTATIFIKILVIITLLMILLEMLKGFNLIPRLVTAMRPVLRAFGLSPDVGLLWLTAGAFGIAYGSAVIVQESKDHPLSKRDLERLHLSIGVNHAMIEDPALFLPLGISAFWLWVPRAVMAIVAVQVLNLYDRLRRAKARPVTEKTLT